ncbi:hypothetical protein EVAR_13540_1 [Eumeta japonica]|uniref:Uncharacterized protein n=1 Tax=Eumeta variegata TaxID=151549 RepID=A0A4C1U9I2_EUMVA|nr:hypothetical protein EVAR_13540_1 [Eumeta japonica]
MVRKWNEKIQNTTAFVTKTNIRLELRMEGRRIYRQSWLPLKWFPRVAGHPAPRVAADERPRRPDCLATGFEHSPLEAAAPDRPALGLRRWKIITVYTQHT